MANLTAVQRAKTRAYTLINLDTCKIKQQYGFKIRAAVLLHKNLTEKFILPQL